MKSLLEFWQDKDTKNNVKNYLIEYLEKEAVKKVFSREDVSAISEAKEVIDKAFDNMDLMFEPKKQKEDVTNPAR